MTQMLKMAHYFLCDGCENVRQIARYATDNSNKHEGAQIADSGYAEIKVPFTL